MKAVIIDDEHLAVQIVKEYLEDYPEIEIIGEANNGFNGLKLINDMNPDLVFLDIQMSKLTGLEMLELIEKMPQIIFTTAYEEHAIAAFDKDAVDYLLKPFSKKRFAQAIDKVTKRLANNDSLDYSNIFENLSNTDGKFERVAVKEGGKIFIVNVNEIYYIQAAEDYIIISTENNEYVKHSTLRFFEDKLPDKNFVRIHRSTIINIDFIKEIQPLSKESLAIIMKNGKSLKTSRTGNMELKNLLK